VCSFKVGKPSGAPRRQLLMRSITSISPTISTLMGIEPPELARGRPLSVVTRAAKRALGGRTAKKLLIYAPDAIGSALFDRHEPAFAQVIRLAPFRVKLSSVFPPKTPVCFASIFTGAQPKSHGIRRYMRPVLTCDTLFDALARGEKKVAIVAVEDSSMSIIFGGRKVSYFIEEYDGEVNERAMDLIASGSHDIVLAYNQGYDDTMHKTKPESQQSLRVLNRHVRDFVRLAMRMKECWSYDDSALMWLTDHGAHIDPLTGKGTHGERIPEDMIVNEFFGFYPRKQSGVTG